MNRWNSESHQARLNGRVVTEEDEVNHDYDDIINLPIIQECRCGTVQPSLHPLPH